MLEYLGINVVISATYFEVHPKQDGLMDRYKDRYVIKQV